MKIRIQRMNDTNTKSHNSESTAVEDLNCLTIAAVSHPPAKRWALPSSGRNPLPLSLLLLARMLQQQCWTHLGPLPPRAAWTFTEEYGGLLWYCREKPPPKEETGNKDDLLLWKLLLFTSPPSPLCQDSLNWRSCYWVEAVVRGKWRWPRPSHNPGAAKNTNLVRMFGYAHGRYLMVKTAPSPDGENDDDGRHTTSYRFSHLG
jgi:hypothetical protein